MPQILASGKTGSNKYDKKSIDANKVFPRLDARQLGESLQYLYEVCQGFSYSGDEGSSEAIASNLSVIDTSNIATYTKDITQAVQTLVSNMSRLEVDGASTANALTLNAPYITEEDAPDGNNYKKQTPLPFKYKDGLSFTFMATATNTGAMTVQIPDLADISGAVDLVDEDGNDLVGGELETNRYYTIIAKTISTVKKFVLKTLNISSATITQKGKVALLNPITISNNVSDPNHDIDFTAGNAILSDGSGQVVATAETKQLDANWVAGTNQGGLAESLTIAADKVYYPFVIADDDNNFVGFGFDTSLTASNLLAGTNVIAAGGTKYKKIASFVTDGGANIRTGNYTFNPDGSYKFEYTDRIVQVNGAFSTNNNFPIAAPPLKHAILDLQLDQNNNGTIRFESNVLGTNNYFEMRNSWNSGGWSGGYNNAQIEILTDSSREISITVVSSGTGVLVTKGWIDNNL